MNVNVSFQNHGRTAAENNYTIRDRSAGIELELDHSGSAHESDFRVTGTAPNGEIDFFIDNSGSSKYENDFRFSGHDLTGNFNLKVDNSGRSKYENDYSIKGQAYGEIVDLRIENSGNGKYENDFAISGEAPDDFLSSPLFAGIISPTLATAPVLNENHEATYVGPLMFNYANSILSAIKQQQIL